jgi:hypothetical protein
MDIRISFGCPPLGHKRYVRWAVRRSTSKFEDSITLLRAQDGRVATKQLGLAYARTTL